MNDVTVLGREFAIEFEWASQGHRITAMEWDGEHWITVPGYDQTLCLMQSQFETLCNLSSDLFDEAVHGETFAELLGIPMIGFDDEYEDA